MTGERTGDVVVLLPDFDTFLPALGSSGAYGGPWALAIVCRFLPLSRRAVGAEFPLVGTNRIRGGDDLARMVLAGASAGEALSVVMLEGFSGWRRILAELDAVLAARGLVFGELVGRAAGALGGYGAQAERPGRWRGFVPEAAR